MSRTFSGAAEPLDRGIECIIFRKNMYKYHLCNCGGIASLRLYPVGRPATGEREDRSKTDIHRKIINERVGLDNFKSLVFSNFTESDFSITLTFTHNVSDEQRKRLLDKFIRRLRKVYAELGAGALRYLYVVGRGEHKRALHAHLLCQALPCHRFRAILMPKLEIKGLTVHIERIKGAYAGRCAIEIMKSCIKYLWTHYDSLTAADKRVYKCRFYPCKGLNRSFKSAKRRNGDTLKKRLEKAFQKGADLAAVIERCFPGYKFFCEGWGHTEELRRLDDWGRVYYRATLIKCGGVYDRGKG